MTRGSDKIFIFKRFCIICKKEKEEICFVGEREVCRICFHGLSKEDKDKYRTPNQYRLNKVAGIRRSNHIYRHHLPHDNYILQLRQWRKPKLWP